MYTVKVSARILTVPFLCCCCGCSEAKNIKYTVYSTRITGQRVIRSDTRSWDFPICAKCSDWITEQKDANKLKNFIIKIVIAGILFDFVLIINSISVLVLFSFILGGISLFLYKKWRIKQSYADYSKPNLNCKIIPIRYDGWNGSIHTFQFTNATFCEEFQICNEKKLLES